VVFCDFHAVEIQHFAMYYRLHHTDLCKIYYRLHHTDRIHSDNHDIEHFDNCAWSDDVIKGRTAAVCEAEKEWRLVLFRWSSSLRESKFSVQ
jgi:hypothetical protein